MPYQAKKDRLQILLRKRKWLTTQRDNLSIDITLIEEEIIKLQEALEGKKRRRQEFVIIRTIWPYNDGWGVYSPSTKTVLYTGLTKDKAIERCEALNEDE